ncbi:MAG: cobaltochelatase subunit CobN, partial [Alphaproteobacteria bacterium]
MHLLVTQPGQISDGEEAVDLDQSAGDIVILSSAASDLAIISAARARLEEFPFSVRLANLMQLSHNMSVDLYLEKTIAQAKLVIVRLLGGAGYWPYGMEQLRALCQREDIMLVAVPGDDRPDAELIEYSTAAMQDSHRVWQYFTHGGLNNAKNLLQFAATLLGNDNDWQEPAPIARAGLYWPRAERPDLDPVSQHWHPDGATVPIVFYKALVQADDLAPIDALCEALADQGLNPLPIYVSSLKDDFSAAFVEQSLTETDPGIIINCTGFAVSTPGKEMTQTPFAIVDCPVLQAVLSGGNREGWEDSARGLSPRDLAMNVALPEVDGRMITRAISFKNGAEFDKHDPISDRIEFVAETARRWIDLRKTSKSERKVAIILANYPNKDGRLGNGVGLDTPAGVIATLSRLTSEGYALGNDVPTTSGELMELLLAGPT